MTMRNTVLIVDDEKVNRLNLKKILEDVYDIVEASDGGEAINILEREGERISAVVLDLIMPGVSGYQFMEYYQKSEAFGLIPVIVATVENHTETERECLELGAWDFVTKPYDPVIIRFRVKNVIERSQHQLSKQLKYRTEYDALTDVFNMAKFYYNTRKMIDDNPEEKFVFIRMDIQKFQLINAFFGRKEGDCLLKYIADFLKKDSKSKRLVTYGYIRADIFSICMAYKRKKEITAYIEKISSMLTEYPIDFDIIPAFGIYLVEERELPVSEMFERANLASKRCKGNYIHNYVYYEPEMTDEIVKEQIIVNNMRNALKQNQFVLYLQPKYELQSNTMAGAEVLVRWKDPERGMISPGDFIPVFERNGFIMKLDYYVWDKTCQLISKWLREGRNPYPISVNISRVSLYNPRLVDVICGLVEKYGIPPELLQLELTESAYTNNQQVIKKMMEQLQEKGFCVLMDDFGSGYSSLNILKDIAVNILKIDMKFLSDTDNVGRSENILASVVRMAKWLNMPVVAEGVERRDQVSFLRSIGCEYVQGFYFARPMPVEEYEKLAFSADNHFMEQAGWAVGNADNIWTQATQMEILFSNMLQAVAMYEYEDGYIEAVRVNNAYYDMLGFSDINHVQENIINTVNGKNREILLSAFERVVENKDVADCEFTRKLEDREIWIKLKLKYIEKVGNKHVIFGCLNDITTQKEIDAELQKYREVLKSVDPVGETILIVDDMEENRASLRRIFEGKYCILEAANGQEAIEILEKESHPVNLILLDLAMPVMDGVEFLKYKHGKISMAGIPVIVITVDDTTQQQAETMKLGASDYIVKPFIPEIVVRRVENVLCSARSIRRVLKEGVRENHERTDE